MVGIQPEMVRRGDHATSIAAAEHVAKSISQTQAEVYEHIRKFGPMIDADLTRHFMKQGYAESTARKRRSELVRKGLIVAVGVRRNDRNRPMILWDVKRAFTD